MAIMIMSGVQNRSAEPCHEEILEMARGNFDAGSAGCIWLLSLICFPRRLLAGAWVQE